MENNNKKFHYIIISVLALVFVATITISSYAYFTATVTGTSNNNIVTTGSMEIEFSDGPQVGLDNIVPGSFVEKTFSVRNTGTVDTYYDIYMSDLINNFADKTDLVYTLTSSNGASVSETQVPDENTKIVQNQALAVGQTHNYTLRITFKETNDNQDDNKGKTFSTVIRVNEVKELDTLINKVNSLADGADTTSTDVIGNTNLAYDGTEDNNLRYVGSNPNNYVKFNNELWRIVGVMNNMKTSTNDTQNLVKIVRNESLGNYAWDTSNGINRNYGVNQWGETTLEDGTPYEGADLMRELNNDYLGNIVVGNEITYAWNGSIKEGTDGKWYNGSYDNKEALAPTSILNQTAQQMIESVVWKTTTINLNDNEIDNLYDSKYNVNKIYMNERYNQNLSKCTTSDCNDNVIRTTSWTGKVALLYPSDFGFSTVGGQTSDRQSCLTTTMYSWYESQYNDCSSNSWLYKGNEFNNWVWTLSNQAMTWINDKVFYYGDNLPVEGQTADINLQVYPSLYLKKSVLLVDGDGTQNNPYIIAN